MFDEKIDFYIKIDNLGKNGSGIFWLKWYRKPLRLFLGKYLNIRITYYVFIKTIHKIFDVA